MDSDLLYDDDIDIVVDEDEQVAVDTESQDTESQDDDSSDDKDYSKKVQQRISKVVQQRNIERDRRAALEKENNELREALHKNNAKASDDTIAQLKKQKVDALEIGDYQAVSDIDDQLMDYRTQQPVQETQQQPQAELPKTLTDWQQKNQWVFDNNNPKTKKANEIYAALLDEGYDDNDPDLFSELDKKLKRQIPPPTSSPDRGQVTAGNGVQFTAQDKELMTEFGLDPNNQVHRKQWAISKKAANNG